MARMTTLWTIMLLNKTRLHDLLDMADVKLEFEEPKSASDLVKIYLRVIKSSHIDMVKAYMKSFEKDPTLKNVFD